MGDVKINAALTKTLNLTMFIKKSVHKIKGKTTVQQTSKGKRHETLEFSKELSRSLTSVEIYPKRFDVERH